MPLCAHKKEPRLARWKRCHGGTEPPPPAFRTDGRTSREPGFCFSVKVLTFSVPEGFRRGQCYQPPRRCQYVRRSRLDHRVSEAGLFQNGRSARLEQSRRVALVLLLPDVVDRRGEVHRVFGCGYVRFLRVNQVSACLPQFDLLLPESHRPSPQSASAQSTPATDRRSAGSELLSIPCRSSFEQHRRANRLPELFTISTGFETSP